MLTLFTLQVTFFSVVYYLRFKDIKTIFTVCKKVVEKAIVNFVIFFLRTIFKFKDLDSLL